MWRITFIGAWFFIKRLVNRFFCISVLIYTKLTICMKGIRTKKDAYIAMRVNSMASRKIAQILGDRCICGNDSPSYYYS